MRSAGFGRAPLGRRRQNDRRVVDGAEHALHFLDRHLLGRFGHGVMPHENRLQITRLLLVPLALVDGDGKKGDFVFQGCDPVVIHGFRFIGHQAQIPKPKHEREPYQGDEKT